MKKFSLVALTLLGLAPLSARADFPDFSWIGEVVKAQLSYRIMRSMLRLDAEAIEQCLTGTLSFMDITMLKPLRNIWLSAVDNPTILQGCLPESPLLKLKYMVRLLKR